MSGYSATVSAGTALIANVQEFFSESLLTDVTLRCREEAMDRKLQFISPSPLSGNLTATRLFTGRFELRVVSTNTYEHTKVVTPGQTMARTPSGRATAVSPWRRHFTDPIMKAAAEVMNNPRSPGK